MKNLHWIKENEIYLLKNENQTLVTLTASLTAKSIFTIDNKQYYVTRKGLWNPVYIITSNDEVVAKLSHSFWGSNGKIVFANGNEYRTEYKTKRGFKLSFFDKENEILSFVTEIKNGQVSHIFNVGIALEDAEQLLIFSALGKIIVTNMYKELSNDDTILLLLTATA